jgi:SulP family sulfate permease
MGEISFGSDIMSPRFRFNRLEFSGSLGDLGTILPLALGMILINKLDPMGLFLSVGLFFIGSGLYYGVTAPVQPMKVVGAYAVATGISAGQIMASAILLGVILLIIGATGAVNLIGRYTPKSVVRGVQLSTGALLMAGGVKFMLGTSRYQEMLGLAEPHLSLQALGPLPIGIVIGVAGGVLTLLLLDNKKLPAGLVVVLAGLGLGLWLGAGQDLERLSLGLNLPQWLPFGWPGRVDFSLALIMLVLPQIPMTLGNAVIANADLSQQYFGQDSRRVTYRSLCISMALANFGAFVVGGMPLCHGAGGLAAHYRFGARTAGSNLMIGAIFVALAILLGSQAVIVVNLIPMAVLGVLLLFAGSQLALTLLDIHQRKDMFVCLTMLGITLASNLAVGFVVGLALAYALRSERLSV